MPAGLGSMCDMDATPWPHSSGVDPRTCSASRSPASAAASGRTRTTTFTLLSWAGPGGPGALASLRAPGLASRLRRTLKSTGCGRQAQALSARALLLSTVEQGRLRCAGRHREVAQGMARRQTGN